MLRAVPTKYQHVPVRLGPCRKIRSNYKGNWNPHRETGGRNIFFRDNYP